MLRKILNFFKIIKKPQVFLSLKEHERISVGEECKVQQDIILFKEEKNTVTDKEKKEYFLERTGNPHVLKAVNYKVLDKRGTTETLFISENSFITHNEHETLYIESEYFIKYIQQEYNPITQAIENAYD
ncbi:hypothetical protein [Chryseobacterium turcicum]|uniref:Uncharacterized protein n=1 Tax=Chryseobacterium turcicum TaxID=2898076 RepID=A0A9Q3YWJ9_9FLAO|nr:hypothetical protein [Chryseobacterium turcicum]MCD1118631.1 hypothetical protein [Chryseobacterium turcicum]